MIEPLTTRASVAFANASADTRAAGAAWYPAARRVAAGLARKHGVTVDRAAAVIAATSPTQTWKGNVTVADRVLADPDGYGARLMAAHAQAVPIARGRRSLELQGPKVSAFSRAIRSSGRAGRAVVDRWMIRALGLGESVTPKTYAAAADALARAAALHGVDVHTLQATVWIAVRGGAE